MTSHTHRLGATPVIAALCLLALGACTTHIGSRDTLRGTVADANYQLFLAAEASRSTELAAERGDRRAAEAYADRVHAALERARGTRTDVDGLRQDYAEAKQRSQTALAEAADERRRAIAAWISERRVREARGKGCQDPSYRVAALDSVKTAAWRTRDVDCPPLLRASLGNKPEPPAVTRAHEAEGRAEGAVAADTAKLIAAEIRLRHIDRAVAEIEGLAAAARATAADVVAGKPGRTDAPAAGPDLEALERLLDTGYDQDALGSQS